MNKKNKIIKTFQKDAKMQNSWEIVPDSRSPSSSFVLLPNAQRKKKFRSGSDELLLACLPAIPKWYQM